MAGRHRKPPAWRRLLTSLFRNRYAAQNAALLAEVRALRQTVAELRRDLELARAEAAAAAAMASPRWLTVPLTPSTTDAALVPGSPSVPLDRSEDEPVTEIVLADLPESKLLDPKADRGEDADIRVTPAPAPAATPAKDAPAA